ncbi:MAG TPA: hypothetical protein VNI01_01255, partial [Elusimicrobiota bacterium]|nr:hypothetical protein [Elusimicrobiota bacterium]
MNAVECLEWARRHHGLGRGAAARELERTLRVLSKSAPAGLPTNHFQACLNSRDLFSVVKLVHVAESEEPGASVAARRKALLSILRRWNRELGARFDAGLLDRVYSAILAAGARGWYPIMGFEFHPKAQAFPEISLYSEHQPARAARAAAKVLPGVDAAAARALSGDLCALGLDFLADGGARLKLYRSAPPSAAGAILRELDARVHPDSSLSLRRTTPEGPFEEIEKAYVPLRAKAAGQVTSCSGEAFPMLARGRLGAFARAVARAIYGQHLFYLGASSEKTEIYFG